MDLTFSPIGEFARFAGMNFDELNRELRNVNASINKITKGRLTEDAVRRFDDMHNSVAEMHTQIQDCASSIDSVREFKQTLEQVKQEVVERTYKQVSCDSNDYRHLIESLFCFLLGKLQLAEDISRARPQWVDSAAIY